MSLIHRQQLRAARALIDWSQADLAARSGVSLPTIKRIEVGMGPLETRLETLRKLQSALEGAGAVFSNGDEPGVRLALWRAVSLQVLDVARGGGSLSVRVQAAVDLVETHTEQLRAQGRTDLDLGGWRLRLLNDISEQQARLPADDRALAPLAKISARI